MRKHLMAAVATCSIFFALGATAAAQTGVGTKAVTAVGSTANGLSVGLSAVVPRDATAGDGCVAVSGSVKGRAVRQYGCGPLRVEIDDLLNTGRARGTLNGITLDVSVSGSGLVTPSNTQIVWPQNRSCIGFFQIYWGCYLSMAWEAANGQNPSVKRDGSAAGVLSSSTFGTIRFSGTGTLYLQRYRTQ